MPLNLLFLSLSAILEAANMKISYRWLQQYLPIEESPDELAEILTSLGLEVSGVETVYSVPGGLEGVIVAQVLTCEPHPNANRLSLTTVDIGSEKPLPIVCGAPNVAAGQKVLVALPGTTIHPTEGEPFEISARKVRGEMSEGMICAEDELSLGTDHAGIVVLPDDAPIGQPAAEYYEVEKDHVFDIDLTPNRSDATSHIGVALDLDAWYRIHKGYTGGVKWPDVSGFKAGEEGEGIQVEVLNPAACPRYAGVTLTGIKVGESPQWLQNRLRTIGVRPINVVVDVTNYVLHEMGQPLHAFDVKGIGGGKILVKTLDEGTAFVTLDEVERKLSNEDLMICDANSNGLCIAGVFGGIGSGVTENTTDIFLESAHFHPTWIRRTSMRHQLRTDAAKCFEKTTDSSICVKAVKRAAMMIVEIAGGQIASEIIDMYPNPVEPARVVLRKQYVEQLLGIAIDESEFRNVLDALHFEIEEEKNGSVVIKVPTYKADVYRAADVVEEFLRIYGINRIPLQTRMTTTITIHERPSEYQFRKFLGNHLASLGLHEAMGLSVTSSAHYEKIPGKGSTGNSFVPVLNTSNISLDIMRPDLLVSALETLGYNQSRQQMATQMFEFGRSYHKHSEGYTETEHLTLTLTDRPPHENWLSPDDPEVSFFTLKKYVQTIIERCGITPEMTRYSEPPYNYGMEYAINGQKLARFGEIKKQWLEAFDIKTSVFFADFLVEPLYNAFRQHQFTTADISRFPAIYRDLAIVIPEPVTYADLLGDVAMELGNAVTEVELFDIYRNEEQLGKGNKSYALRFKFEDPGRTLRDEDVDRFMQKLLKTLESRHQARLR